MILAGDIGGTNTRLALYEERADRHPDGLRRIAWQKTPSKESFGLAEIASEFVAKHAAGAKIEAAGFGIAGPVRDGRCVATNLPWVVDARELEGALGLRAGAVTLMNDLEANAHGIGGLATGDFAALRDGALDPRGNKAIISAGTGLGEAGLLRVDGRLVPFATEGGHGTFSPRDETEIELLRYLLREREHVSWEHVLSGPGLVNVYSFLRDTGRGVEEPALRDEIAAGDPGRVVSTAALEERSPLASRALEIFVSLYAHEASNLALRTMATDGVYLGGGIAPRIVERLKAGGFAESFVGAGRMRPLLETIPVYVILNDGAALLGAARAAASRRSA